MMSTIDRSFRRPKALKVCTGKNSLEKNVISELPDDILIHIISFLTMKEAGRTSLLSKRWRYVWAYVPSLYFYAPEIIVKLWSGEKSVEVEEPRYVCWVDQVVSMHKAPAIDEFWIDFDLQESHKDNIDSWLRFAVEKRVKKLNLSITPTSFFNESSYNFPSLSFCNSLTSLRLSCVDVTGEVLEKVLCDCQTLELVSIESSKSLVNLKVIGSYLNLKSLTIRYCREIKHLEIYAPNLLCIDYYGPKISLQINSTPKLVDLAICGAHASHLLSNLLDLSSCISQIEVLSLTPKDVLQHIAEVFPVCTRLKMLDVEVKPRSDRELFGLLSLINACPVLHKFVLTFNIVACKKRRATRTRKIEECPHYHLKILEIINFTGWDLDMEFSMYLIKKAVSLEKIIIKLTNNITPPETSVEQTRIRVRQMAEQLRSKLNPRIQLEIH